MSIKLERIELLFQVRTDRGHTTVLTRADGDIEWDPATQTVRLPTADRDVIPVAGNVRRMIFVRAELPCPECKSVGRPNVFEDTRALAAHRAHKHQVKGTTRLKEAG